MSKIINLGKEMLRISPEKPTKIEYSNNNGSHWYSRYDNSSSSVGEFKFLYNNKKECLAITNKGLFYSADDGAHWYQRNHSNSYGVMLDINDGGNELLANTSSGLYYSKDDGNHWYKK